MKLKSGSLVELIESDHLYNKKYKYNTIYAVEIDEKGPFILNEDFERDYRIQDLIFDNPDNWRVS